MASGAEMRSQQEERARNSVTPTIESKLFKTAGLSDSAVEEGLVNLVIERWNIQFCVCLPSGDLVYTAFRATTPETPTRTGMAVR